MDDDTADDAAIWQRALAGDGASFAALFRLHHPRVYRRILGIVGNAHDAQEVTASTFFELWRKRRGVRLVGGSVLPWLIATAVNLAQNRRRGTARYRKMIDSLPHSDAPDAETIATSNVETELLGVRLTTALRKLSKTDAALLVLTVLDGLTTVEAATVVNINPGAARMRLHRAREKLRADLADDPALAARRIPEGEHV
ncbi:RNA polymerase sigma factor [Gryllotalpicola reticulitermitis]|uniref:RNA polymerase sigma factor n=1 Tax=Gryllotalpicola reticulitermitis TaxID=1184153 RepID=A0ABV8Q3Z2_9MICO